MSGERRTWLGIGRHNQRTQEAETIDPDRLVGFSDGVFAVAITLLVLSINLPNIPAGESLADSRNEIGAYLLSFAVIGRFWIAHHSLLGSVGKPDFRLAFLNLAFLAVIVFMPIPTELVGSYGGEISAFAAYAVTISLALAASLAMQVYITKQGLLKPEAPHYRVNDLLIGASIPIGIFLGSIGLVELVGDTSVGYWSWLLMILINPSIRKVPAPSQ